MEVITQQHVVVIGLILMVIQQVNGIYLQWVN
jgi:hypothetical protein